MRAGRDRRIRTSASGSQSPLPCAAWLCLHIISALNSTLSAMGYTNFHKYPFLDWWQDFSLPLFILPSSVSGSWQDLFHW